MGNVSPSSTGNVDLKASESDFGSDWSGAGLNKYFPSAIPHGHRTWLEKPTEMLLLKDKFAIKVHSMHASQAWT